MVVGLKLKIKLSEGLEDKLNAELSLNSMNFFTT